MLCFARGGYAGCAATRGGGVHTTNASMHTPQLQRGVEWRVGVGFRRWGHRHGCVDALLPGPLPPPFSPSSQPCRLPAGPRPHPQPRTQPHPHPAGQLDVEEACRGFLDVAKEAAAALVASVFADPAFADLLTRLCCTDEWRAGGVTASVLATLEDFLQDFQRWVEPGFCRRWAGRGRGRVRGRAWLQACTPRVARQHRRYAPHMGLSSARSAVCSGRPPAPPIGPTALARGRHSFSECIGRVLSR